MAVIKTYTDSDGLVSQVASQTIALIKSTIELNGSCTWVLAGGSTPVMIYRHIARNLLSNVDWTKVTILIGDERMVPADSAESNWHQAEQELLHYIPEANLLRPPTARSLPEAVDHYRSTVEQLPASPDGYPIFDIVWLGVGEDGHTLSLFPDSPVSQDLASLVLAIEDSPKPPSQRLTLGLSALKGTKNLMIIASGETKANAISRATKSQSLPVSKAVRIVENSGGNAIWQLDEAAAAEL